jgi:hypothetical protein
MTDFIVKLLAAVILLFIISILSGTVLWVIYPHIHSLFPNAAINGIIAKDLNWWDSVCITWIFSILLKSSNSNSNKD